MSLACKERPKSIILPSIVASMESGKKIRNTSIWISEEGDIVQRYQKLHLFEMNIENGL